MKIAICVATASYLALCGPSAAQPSSQRAAKSPARTCTLAEVARVESRLEGVAGSGSLILYQDGRHQVSYETVAAVEASRPGDDVMLCATDFDQNCRPEEGRGYTYEATNQRTGRSWTLPDSIHYCDPHPELTLEDDGSIPLPLYPVDAVCAATPASSDLTGRACVSQEQAAYDYLRVVWDETSNEVRTTCKRIAEAGPYYRYSRLEACVWPRLQLDRMRSQGPFRY
jgi:hypothetical protein